MTSHRITYPIVETFGEKYTFCNEDLIGKGSYSEIYRGRTTSGMVVAVKTACKRIEIKSIKTEIEILRKLDGAPNIVKWFGSNHTRNAPGSVAPETISFAMEFAKCSVNDEMRKPENYRGLPADVFFDLVVDCARALLDLHKRNIAHRDIKHMNILMFPGTPTRGRRSSHLFKFCDLGCAKALSEDGPREMNTLAGTPNMLHPYMAKEMVDPRMAQKSHDWKTKSPYTPEQCDLWSLGCTLYYCATGTFIIDYSHNDKLYNDAVEALTKNRNAIAMTPVKMNGRHTRNDDKFVFKPVTELPSKANRYPKWLVCTVTCLLRRFFHEPSIEYYAKVADAMQSSKRAAFLSIDQMCIVDHTDLSNDPHLGSSMPTISSSLGYPDGTDLLLLSNTSTQYADSKRKTLNGLTDDVYLVLPQGNEVDIRPILSRNIAFNEVEDMTSNMLAHVRNRKCYEGLRMLVEADEYITLYEKVSTILSTHFSLLIAELNQFDRVQTASRFASYINMTSISMLLFDEADQEAKDISKHCIQQAKQAQEELDRHVKVNFQIEDMAKLLAKDANDLRLDDIDLPGIREEISSYFFYDKANILKTQEYSQLLVEKCLERRNHIIRQILNSPDKIRKSKLKQAIDLAASLSQLRADHHNLQNTISECIALIEKPFQIMNNVVDRYLHKQGLSSSSIEKSMHYLSPEFRNEQLRLKKTTKSCKTLSEELNKEIESFGFVRVGDTLVEAQKRTTVRPEETLIYQENQAALSGPSADQCEASEQNSSGETTTDESSSTAFASTPSSPISNYNYLQAAFQYIFKSSPHSTSSS